MTLKNLIYLILCVLIVSFTSKVNCFNLSYHKHHPSTYSFFVFGDSILDVGNNNYINTTTLDRANFWPYGITFFHSPTGRFSDGRLISDFIAEHANLPLIPPYLKPGKRRFFHGVNFASAGAGALVETFQGSVIDMHMQLRNYKKVEKWYKRNLGDVKAKRRLTKAVYLLSIGTNDYMSLFLTNSTMSNFTKSLYINMVIGNITTLVNEIYNAGGRKFVFLNVPPAGCVPGLRILNTISNGDCLKEVQDYIRLHNKAFFLVLKQIEKKLPGFKFSLYDFYTSTLQRIKHPSKYGFTEAETACCGTGKFRGVFSCGGKRLVKQYELCKNVGEHLFWDSFHFTEKANMQIADELWNNINYVPDTHHPAYSIKDFFYIP